MTSPSTCDSCGKEVPTEERLRDFEAFYEAERSIDCFEFAPAPEPPFCHCMWTGEDPTVVEELPPLIDEPWEERTDPSIPMDPPVILGEPHTPPPVLDIVRTFLRSSDTGFKEVDTFYGPVLHVQGALDDALVVLAFHNDGSLRSIDAVREDAPRSFSIDSVG